MDLDNFGGYFGGSLMTEMRKKNTWCRLFHLFVADRSLLGFMLQLYSHPKDELLRKKGQSMF